MTGVLNSAVGNGGKFSYSVSVVNVGGTATLYGFNDSAGAPTGSISPTTFRGSTIRAATSRQSSGYDFSITINGEVPQSYFQYVMVEGTDGAWDIYRQADASYASSITTIWSWGSGSNRSWTSDSPSPRKIIVAF
jgi:hypothetical protein